MFLSCTATFVVTFLLVPKMAPSKNYTLLPRGEASPARKSKGLDRPIWKWAALVPALLGATILAALVFTSLDSTDDVQSLNLSGQSACPQYPPIKASSSEKFPKEISDEINSPAFFSKSLKRLQGAVQIPTESFDDMGKVGNDSRWDIFKDFHVYLEETFPLV